MSFDRYIVSVDQIESGNVLAVTYDDSSISFFNSKTMTSFIGTEDPNTVTSMAQAGFHYPLDVSGSFDSQNLIFARLISTRSPHKLFP